MTVAIETQKELRDLATDPTKNITNCFSISENCLLAIYRCDINNRRMIPDNSTIVGSFTLAYARLWLYKYIEKLSARCGVKTAENALYWVIKWANYFIFVCQICYFLRTLIA